MSKGEIIPGVSKSEREEGKGRCHHESSAGRE